MKYKRIMALLLSLSIISGGMPAFAASLKSIKLPAQLKEIEGEAFYGSTSIEKVIVPEGTTKINAKAFANSSLQAVELPYSLEEIADDAFDGCGEMAFSAAIGSFAEEWCIEREIEYGYTDLKYSLSSEGAVITQYSGSAEKVVIPAQLEGKPVIKIDDRAFSGNTNLKRVEIPEGVTVIGHLAFNGCSNLSEVVFPSTLQEIWGSAFHGCGSAVTEPFEFVLPDNIVRVFGRLYNSYNIGAGTTVYGSFRNCNAQLICDRESQTAKTLSGGSYVFSAPGQTDFGYIYSGDVLCLDSYIGNGTNVKIPSGVERISNSAFANNTTVESVSIPEGVTHIEHRAFQGCSNLTEVVFPSTLQEIWGSAFEGCGAESAEKLQFVLPDNIVHVYGNLANIYSSDVGRVYGSFRNCNAQLICEEGSTTEATLNGGGYEYAYGEFKQAERVFYGLSGRVKSQNNSGLENVYVLILDNTNQGDIVASDTTDRSGCWNVDGLEAGLEYQVAYYHPDYVITPQFLRLKQDVEINCEAKLAGLENDVQLSFSMTQNGKTISSAVVGSKVDFTVDAPGAGWVRLVVDGVAYEEYELNVGGHGEFSRMFSGSGERQVSFQAYKDGAYGACCTAQMLAITAVDGSMAVESLAAPVVNAISGQIINTEFTASWQQVENADGYHVYLYSGDLKLWDGEVNSGNVCEIQVPAPQNAGNYTLVVMAYAYGYNQSEGSAAVAVHDTASALEFANAAQLSEGVLGGTARVELASFDENLYKRLVITRPDGTIIETEAVQRNEFFVDFTMIGTYAIQAQGCIQQDFSGEIYSTGLVNIVIDANPQIESISHDGETGAAGIHYDTQDMPITVEMNFVADSVKVFEGDELISESTVRNGWYAMDCVLPKDKLGAGVHALRIAAYYGEQEIDSEDYTAYIVDYVDDSAVYYLAGDTQLLHMPSDGVGIGQNAGAEAKLFGVLDDWKYVRIGSKFGFVNVELLNEWAEDVPVQEIDPEGIVFLSGGKEAVRSAMNAVNKPIWFAPAQGDLTARMVFESAPEEMSVNIVFTNADKEIVQTEQSVVFHDDGTVDVKVPAQFIEANGSGTYRFYIGMGDAAPTEKAVVTVYEPVAQPYNAYSNQNYLDLYAHVWADAQRYYSEKTNETVSYENAIEVYGGFGEAWSIIHCKTDEFEGFRWVPSHFLSDTKPQERKRAFLVFGGCIWDNLFERNCLQDARNRMKVLFAQKDVYLAGEYLPYTVEDMDYVLDTAIAETSKWYDKTYIYMFMHGATSDDVQLPCRWLGSTVVYDDETILRKISAIPGEVVLIMESCYSGQIVELAEGLENDDGTPLLPRDKFSLITSTRSDESAGMTANALNNTPAYTMAFYDYCMKHSDISLDELQENIGTIKRLTADKTNLFGIEFKYHMDYYGNDDNVVFE